MTGDYWWYLADLYPQIRRLLSTHETWLCQQRGTTDYKSIDSAYRVWTYLHNLARECYAADTQILTGDTDQQGAYNNPQ